jgi:hypothetical protein
VLQGRADGGVWVLAWWAIFGQFITLSLHATTPLGLVLEIEPFLGRFLFSAHMIWLLGIYLNWDPGSPGTPVNF